jgi:hypothetical protein
MGERPGKGSDGGKLRGRPNHFESIDVRIKIDLEWCLILLLLFLLPLRAPILACEWLARRIGGVLKGLAAYAKSFWETAGQVARFLLGSGGPPRVFFSSTHADLAAFRELVSGGLLDLHPSIELVRAENAYKSPLPDLKRRFEAYGADHQALWDLDVVRDISRTIKQIRRRWLICRATVVSLFALGALRLFHFWR